LVALPEQQRSGAVGGGNGGFPGTATNLARLPDPAHPLMTAARAGLGTVGVPTGRVHAEAFGAEAPITPGIVAHPARPPHPPRRQPRRRTGRVLRADGHERPLG